MNDDPNHPLYQRGVSISRSGLRRVDELARSLEEATAAGDGGIMGAFDEAGVQVGFNTTPGFKAFPARLIGQNSAPYADMYAFIGIYALPNGSSDLTLTNDVNYFLYPANTYNAKEVNGTTTIPVPAGPTSLSGSLVAGGTLTVGTAYYWVVTENLTNTATSASVQSPISNEVTLTPTTGNQTASLSWTAPTVPSGFTRTGYSVWRGTSAGGENVLVTSGIAAGTTTYSDTGSAGTAQSPVVGGTAGPIVWIWPSAVEDFWEFEYQPVSNNLTVKDGTTTVSNVTTLKFTSGATVTNAGGGEADVAISSSSSFSGAQFSGLPATTCGTGATTSLSQATGTTIYDTGSPAYGLTLKAPTAGYYAGVFTMVMTSGTTAFAAHVVTSGAQQLADSVTNSGTAGGSLNVSWQGHLAANETVALQVFQASGGSTTCNIKTQSIAKIG